MAKLTPIERFIQEIPPDRRRAFDQRERDRGVTRVTVSVPIEEVENLKTFARLLRNSEPHVLAGWKRDFLGFLADTYQDFDEACERGEA